MSILDGGAMIIDSSQLAFVVGGNDNSSFGRCGPGNGMQFLGNVYTPECATHDAQVRGNLANGDSRVMAHIKALPALPAAIGSYFRERLR
jgi:hypothetical protein